MIATDAAATSGSRPEPVSVTYRRLQRMGFGDPQAANLTALTNGFGITSQPWRVRELEHLLFLRELCRTGRRWSVKSDRASRIEGSGLPAFPPKMPAHPVATRTWESLAVGAHYFGAIGKEG